MLSYETLQGSTALTCSLNSAIINLLASQALHTICNPLVDQSSPVTFSHQNRTFPLGIQYSSINPNWQFNQKSYLFSYSLPLSKFCSLQFSLLFIVVAKQFLPEVRVRLFTLLLWEIRWQSCDSHVTVMWQWHESSASYVKVIWAIWQSYESQQHSSRL